MPGTCPEAVDHDEDVPVRLKDCHNVDDFRKLAKQRLPGPIYHYIDGAADDEVTKDRNTEAFNDCDLVPNVLAGVETIDMKTTVMGREIAMPLFLSPTALQRLFHWQGERAVARVAQSFGTWLAFRASALSLSRRSGAQSQRPRCSSSTSTRTRG